MKRSYLIAGLLFTTLFVSCKKDDDTTPAKTKKELIQQKWIVDKQTYIGFDGISDYDSTTYAGTATDYIDFRNNGFVYSSFQGEYDTLSYSIINDDSINIDGDAFRITTLTENNFSIYHYETATDHSFEKVWLDLKK